MSLFSNSVIKEDGAASGLLLFINVFPFFTLSGSIYQLKDDSFAKIPQHYFQYLEGYSHDIDLQILSKANWKNNLHLSRQKTI